MSGRCPQWSTAIDDTLGVGMPIPGRTFEIGGAISAAQLMIAIVGRSVEHRARAGSPGSCSGLGGTPCGRRRPLRPPGPGHGWHFLPICGARLLGTRIETENTPVTMPAQLSGTGDVAFKSTIVPAAVMMDLPRGVGRRTNRSPRPSFEGRRRVRNIYIILIILSCVVRAIRHRRRASRTVGESLAAFPRRSADLSSPPAPGTIVGQRKSDNNGARRS